MVIVNPEDITDVAEEFADINPNVIEFYIESARDYVNEGRWGEKKAKRGIMLMAMHLMSTAGLGTNAIPADRGAVISESVGGISTTYANNTSTASTTDDQWLLTTTYGAQFLMLKKTVVKTPLVT